MLYPHTVTHYRATSTVDGDGNPIRKPGAGASPVAAFMQPRTGGEEASGPGQRSATETAAYLSSGAVAMTAHDAIEWNGHRYTVVGDPIDTRGIDGALRYWRVELRRTGDNHG